MPRREDFDNSLWSDPDFLALSSAARLTYIWTWSNPRCGMAGIYKLSPAQATLELGLDEATVTAALAELGEARFAFYEMNVLWVRSRVKHLRQKTTQIATAIRSDLARIPNGHPLKVQFVETYGKLGWLSAALAGDPQEGPVKPIHPDEGRVTLNGGGNGSGVKGWGAGKGNNRFSAPTSLAWAPSPEDVAMRDEHFPDWEVEAVANSAATLRLGRKPVTVEAVRGLLTGEEAA
jgi:hypothetical protein